ncbi:ABC transporter permease [Streptomyces sp. NPDC059783]|uniref:ABC transporter permease n=1 Tax=Streptomyces sp. NPDC059783 TaxID=3346944 RepID=UPI0036675286
MTATAPTTAAAAEPVPRDAPPARFRDLLAAEWLKTWSLRSTPWMYVITALSVVAFNVGTAYDQYRYWNTYDEGSRASFVRDGLPLITAFTANAAMVLLLALAAIGAVAVTAEYGTGLIRTTFTAVPARRSVMAAKVLVLAAVTTVFGAAVSCASFAATQAVLDARGAGVSLGHPGALQVVAASALLAPVAALTGLAVGTVIRHTAGSVVAGVVLLILVPVFLSERRHLTAVLAHTLPFTAWQRLTETAVRNGPPEMFPWSETGAWTVCVLWLLVACAVPVLVVGRRDH